MALRKFLTGAVALTVLVGPVWSQPRPPSPPDRKKFCEIARDLFRSLENNRRLNVEAIIERRNGVGDDSMIRLKLQQSTAGTQRIAVIAPLRMQGVLSFDDGRQWHTYLPDENRMLIQPSPRTRQLSVELRRALAERNYRFSLEPSRDIAGRDVVMIIADPVHRDLPERRFFLDEETRFLLRTEVDRQVTLDTLAVTYPREIKEEELQIRPLRPVTTRELPAPKSMDARELRETLGFRPATPKEIPFGFAVVDVQLAGRRDHKMAAVRISDGLATLTVYQASGESAQMLKPGRPDGALTREAKGVRVHAFGDVSDLVLGRILDVFLREILKGLPTLVGTPIHILVLQSSTKSESTTIEVRVTLT